MSSLNARKGHLSHMKLKGFCAFNDNVNLDVYDNKNDLD